MFTFNSPSYSRLGLGKMKSKGFNLFIPVMVALLLISTPSMGQIEHDPLVYLSLKVNMGNYLGAGITLDLVNKSNYSLGIGYHEHGKVPADRPDDYRKGLVNVLAMDVASARDVVKTMSLTGGKVVFRKSDSATRYHLKGGITCSFGRTPTNWVKLEDDYILVENYTYDYEKYRELGILINPTADIPIFRFFGISMGPYAIINRKTVSFGVELSTMIGIVKNN